MAGVTTKRKQRYAWQHPEWLSFIRDGWHILSPVQERLPPGDIGPGEVIS
jgi:hypothetical protein